MAKMGEQWITGLAPGGVTECFLICSGEGVDAHKDRVFASDLWASFLKQWTSHQLYFDSRGDNARYEVARILPAGIDGDKSSVSLEQHPLDEAGSLIAQGASISASSQQLETISFTPADPSKPVLCEDVIVTVLEFAACTADELGIAHYISHRSLLMKTSRLVCHIVRGIPMFWSRLIISPRIPLEFILHCLTISAGLPMQIILRATEDKPPRESKGYNNTPCDFNEYIDQAAVVLGKDVHRCSRLFFAADSPDMLEVLLDSVDSASSHILESIVATFRFDDYRRVQPIFLEDYTFSIAPPFGQVFPPATTLSWCFHSVHRPIATFTTSQSISFCSIAHPSARPVRWDEALLVLGMSLAIDTLLLDGLNIGYTFDITATPPAPFSSDVDTYVSRGPEHILSTVKEIVFLGSCPRIEGGFYQLFSLMHALTCLDMRNASNIFYYAFVFASRLAGGAVGINYNACPSLRQLCVRHISLSSLRELVIHRQVTGYTSLERIVACDPSGGNDATVSAWFVAEGIELVIEHSDQPFTFIM
ncbi:hypothetical protein DFH07DRAFT_772639 [Mycena maculata]|uniref:Uncharacterized protein n=1 Tax=Mycena maculata TaxID=230809 RepID=A0AAD7NFL2_9AGAR|nr:hypothetical protein DFH07DRAFT_772639 [Mycena maculata]